MPTIALLSGSFHKPLVDEMVKEAEKTAKKEKLSIAEEVWVPGSMEKPLALQMLLERSEIDGVVVLGIIERGETKHGLVMGVSVISAIINLQLQYKKPVGIGILGPEILPHQMKPRLRPYARDAVLAAKAMLTLLKNNNK